jgi:hypothetical protein
VKSEIFEGCNYVEEDDDAEMVNSENLAEPKGRGEK